MRVCLCVIVYKFCSVLYVRMCIHISMTFLQRLECVCKSHVVFFRHFRRELWKYCVCLSVLHSSDCIAVNTVYADLMVAIKHDKPPVDGWSFSLHINM